MAVTGERAVDAYVQLNFLESRFEEVSTYPASKMDEGLKKLQADLNNAVAPISGKRRLRAQFEKMQKDHFEAKKKLLNVSVDKLKADIEAKKDEEIVVLAQTNVLKNGKMSFIAHAKDWRSAGGDQPCDATRPTKMTMLSSCVRT